MPDLRPLLRWIPLAGLALVLTACGSDADDRRPAPDVSHLDADLTLLRFDRALMNLDTNDLAAGIAALDEDFGEFADVYLTHVIPLRRGDFSPDEQLDMMAAFLDYPLIQGIDSAVAVNYPDAALNERKEELEQALRYYQYYLPDAPIPDTLTAFLAQFELAGFLYGSGDLAVGLDFFLGPDLDYRAVDPRQPIFSDYLARTYRPEYMTSKLMRMIAEDYATPPPGGRLLDQIIYEGKLLYLLQNVLPETPDSVLLEVTAEQMEWLGENEIAIYAHLQKEDLLYTTAPDVIRRLTQPAPTTSGMPRQSPGRAVNYLGLRIVQSYLRANPEVTLAELFAETDGQRILAGARYKPR